MTGETYTSAYIRLTGREMALKKLAQCKDRERRCEELVRKKVMRKVTSYDPVQKLLRYHYVSIK